MNVPPAREAADRNRLAAEYLELGVMLGFLPDDVSHREALAAAARFRACADSYDRLAAVMAPRRRDGDE